MPVLVCGVRLTCSSDDSGGGDGSAGGWWLLSLASNHPAVAFSLLFLLRIKFPATRTCPPTPTPFHLHPILSAAAAPSHPHPRRLVVSAVCRGPDGCFDPLSTFYHRMALKCTARCLTIACTIARHRPTRSWLTRAYEVLSILLVPKISDAPDILSVKPSSDPPRSLVPCDAPTPFCLSTPDHSRSLLQALKPPEIVGPYAAKV